METCSGGLRTGRGIALNPLVSLGSEAIVNADRWSAQTRRRRILREHGGCRRDDKQAGKKKDGDTALAVPPEDIIDAVPGHRSVLGLVLIFALLLACLVQTPIAAVRPTGTDARGTPLGLGGIARINAANAGAFDHFKRNGQDAIDRISRRQRGGDDFEGLEAAPPH